MANTAPISLEFSRPIDVSRIGSVEMRCDIGANAEERAALARRFGLLDLSRLEAHVTLRRTQAGTALRLKAHLSAEVIQACVVTLEPVAAEIEEDFTVLYGKPATETGGQEVTIDPEAEDVTEPWPEGTLDIGEAVAQELGLALDPYPHAPGALLDSGAPAPAQEEQEQRVNPFSALSKLRKPQDES